MECRALRPATDRQPSIRYRQSIMAATHVLDRRVDGTPEPGDNRGPATCTSPEHFRRSACQDRRITSAQRRSALGAPTAYLSLPSAPSRWNRNAPDRLGRRGAGLSPNARECGPGASPQCAVGGQGERCLTRPPPARPRDWLSWFRAGEAGPRRTDLRVQRRSVIGRARPARRRRWSAFHRRVARHSVRRRPHSADTGCRKGHRSRP
jgi:hypothetical protein